MDVLPIKKWRTLHSSETKGSVDMTHTTTAQVVKVDVEYEAFVTRLAKDKDGRTISNSSKGHALSILRSVFRSAQEYVKLFSGSLSPDVYNDETLIREMKNFVEGKGDDRSGREGKVQVLIQNPADLQPGVGNKFLAELLTLREAGREVEINEVLDQNHLKDAEMHFLVSDDRMYRIEVDIVKNTAVSSFNDAQRAVRLKDVFDDSNKGHVNSYRPASELVPA